MSTTPELTAQIELFTDVLECLDPDEVAEKYFNEKFQTFDFEQNGIVVAIPTKRWCDFPKLQEAADSMRKQTEGYLQQFTQLRDAAGCVLSDPDSAATLYAFGPDRLVIELDDGWTEPSYWQDRRYYSSTGGGDLIVVPRPEGFDSSRASAEYDHVAKGGEWTLDQIDHQIAAIQADLETNRLTNDPMNRYWIIPAH